MATNNLAQLIGMAKLSDNKTSQDTAFCLAGRQNTYGELLERFKIR